MADSRDVPEELGLTHPIRIWRPSRRRTREASDGRPGRRPQGSPGRRRADPAPGIPGMTPDDDEGDELERVRKACEDSGADEEMTDLVLASHRHDRPPLDVVV